MVLRRFQQAGHRPIAAGGRGHGHDRRPQRQERGAQPALASRPSAPTSPAWSRSCGGSSISTAARNSALLVNNYDWMGRFGYLEFLRDVGKHFPVNVMLAKDSVRSRLERSDAGMSYTEFSYMLLQAYDFVHLNEQYGCELQAGGSDQWGNITAGIDLARRIRGVQLYGVTCPLLTKSDGTKMGKTESGALWLSAEKTSPYQLLSILDQPRRRRRGQCLRFFTDLGQEEIDGVGGRASGRSRAGGPPSGGWPPS